MFCLCFQVDFETFKEAFVMILSTAVDFDDLDGMGGISDIDVDDDKSAVSSIAGTVGWFLFYKSLKFHTPTP